MLFNVHSHSEESGIFNYRLGFDQKPPPDQIGFSVGIHPWDVEKIDVGQVLLELKKILQKPNCVALGEVGIDKNCGTNLDLQKEVLFRQIKIAEELQKKVLIIHCVKAYQEILEIKQQFSSSFSWILHGFNGTKELIAELIKHGFYFSVGHLILNPSTKIAKNISSIPLDHLFLETDESQVKIKVIYKETSSKYRISEIDLIAQIEKNRVQVFSK